VAVAEQPQPGLEPEPPALLPERKVVVLQQERQPELRNSSAQPQVPEPHRSSRYSAPAKRQVPEQEWNSCIRPTSWPLEKLSLPKISGIAFA
jgi:hypothetical protein